MTVYSAGKECFLFVWFVCVCVFSETGFLYVTLPILELILLTSLTSKEGNVIDSVPESLEVDKHEVHRVGGGFQ